MTYRAAVVGLTGIGGGPPRPAPNPILGEMMPHRHVDAYAAVARTTVVAVCDLVPALFETFKQNWGARFPAANTYTNHRDMLAHEKLDILSVATSDHRHTQIVVDAAEAGVKGILCEKPFATTLADADRMIAACERNGTRLLVDHTFRWYPDRREAQRIIQSGEIGRLTRIVATWGGPRAMLFRNATHLIDGVNFFADSEPDWLIGELDDEQNDYGPVYKGEGGKDAGKDPGGSAYVHYKNGVRAFINASKGTIGNHELDLICERGRIRIGNACAELWLRQDEDQALVRPFSLLPMRTLKANIVGAVEELCDLLEHGGTPTSSGQDGRRALEVILGILQSSHAGSEKVVFPVKDREPVTA